MPIIQGVMQIALRVSDLGRAQAFYRDALGGVRLMLSAPGGEPGTKGTLVYFNVADLAAAHAELQGRGVRFEQPPHVIARMPDREVSLAWITDPDGNLLGLMSERA